MLNNKNMSNNCLGKVALRLKKNFVLILLFLSFILIYFSYIRADPPAKKIWCYGVYLTDEGFRVISARNRVLFGMPDRTTSLLNKNITFFPLPHLIYLATFKIIGVGFLQARLVSIFFGLLSLIVFFFITKRLFSRNVSFFCLYLLGINHIFIFYSKLALAESILVFFTLLIFYLLISSDKNFIFLFSGFLCGLLIFIKTQSIPFIFSIFFCILIDFKKNLRLFFIRILFFLLGFIGIIIVSFLIMFITKSTELFIRGASSEVFLRLTIFTKEIVKNFLDFPHTNIYFHSPIQSYLGLLLTFGILLKIIKKMEIEFPERFIAFFTILNCIMISIFLYQPIRYFIIMIPFFIIGFGILITQRYKFFIENLFKKICLFILSGYLSIFSILLIISLIDINTIDSKNTISALLISIVMVIIIFSLKINFWKNFNAMKIFQFIFVSLFFIFFISHIILRDAEYILIGKMKISPSLYFYVFIFFIPLFICLSIIPFFLFLYTDNEKKEDYEKISRLGYFIIGILLISSFINIYHYLYWLKTKEYTLYNTSKDIVKITSEECVIFGRAAPTLSIENEIMASSSIHFLPEFILFFKEKNIPIYLLFSNREEYGMFIKTYNNLLSLYGVKNYILLKEYKVLENYDYISNLLLFYVSFR